MATEENGQDLPQEPASIMKGEPHPDAPQDFVVVIAYTSSDGEIEEDFGKLVQDIKALYTFKQNVRAYALVDQAAQNVLSKVEKPKGEPSDKSVLVISYTQPDDTDEAFGKLSRTADKVKELFEDEPDVQINVAIRESADEVLNVFREGA